MQNFKTIVTTCLVLCTIIGGAVYAIRSGTVNARAAVAQGQDPPPLSSLDSTLWMAGKHRPEIVYPGDVDGSFSYSIGDQEVSCVWAWTPPGTTGIAVTTDYATVYRPTAIIGIGTQSICVAGIGAGDATIIEQWGFGTPTTNTLMDAQGNTVYTIVPPPVMSKTVVLLDRDGVEGTISALLPNLGASGAVLAHFFGSRNLYSIDLTTKVATLAIAGTEIALAAHFDRYWVKDHPTKGYLYFMHDSEFGFFTVVEDAASDGVIGGATALQGTDLTDLGFSGGTPVLAAEW
ncbi:MAG: hypothetical protein GY711_10475 [bacterium]|nr:hypothetical protein [bacterium]